MSGHKKNIKSHIDRLKGRIKKLEKNLEASEERAVLLKKEIWTLLASKGVLPQPDPGNDVPSTSGLKQKYIIQKVDGSPVEPLARYFVLRYDEPYNWGSACRDTLRAFADRIEFFLPELAKDLRSEMLRYELPNDAACVVMPDGSCASTDPCIHSSTDELLDLISRLKTEIKVLKRDVKEKENQIRSLQFMQTIHRGMVRTLTQRTIKASLPVPEEPPTAENLSEEGPEGRI